SACRCRWRCCQNFLHSSCICQPLMPQFLELVDKPPEGVRFFIPTPDKPKDGERIGAQMLCSVVATAAQICLLSHDHKLADMSACRHPVRHGAKPAAARPRTARGPTSPQILQKTQEVQVLEITEDFSNP